MTLGSTTRDDAQADIAEAVFEQVRSLLAENPPVALDLDSSLHECGLDSLARMDMLNRIEVTYGIRFSEDSLYDIDTCRDLVEYVMRSTGQGIVVRRHTCEDGRHLPSRRSKSLCPNAPTWPCFPSARHSNGDSRTRRRPGWSQPVLPPQAGRGAMPPPRSPATKWSAIRALITWVSRATLG